MVQSLKFIEYFYYLNPYRNYVLVPYWIKKKISSASKKTQFTFVFKKFHVFIKFDALKAQPVSALFYYRLYLFLELDKKETIKNIIYNPFFLKVGKFATLLNLTTVVKG